MSDSSRPKFEYGWEELRPVRALFFTVLAAQVVGAAISLYAQGTDRWTDVVWQGGALATLPGYLIGLIVQHRANLGSVSEHRSMIAVMGLIAVGLFIAALLQLGEHGAAA